VIEIVTEGPVHVFAAVDNVLVCFYRGSPPASALVDRVPWIERFAGTGRSIGLLVVVGREAGGALPNDEFRRTSKAQSVKYQHVFAFSATVIEGTGTRASLVRSFLRGLAVVAGRNVTVRFFDDVAPAAAWAAAMADGPSESELRTTVEALRARWHKPPSP
jgi:hypothetical protein